MTHKTSLVFIWKYVASGFVLRDKLRRIMRCVNINVYSL